MNPEKVKLWNGLNHERLGVRCPTGAVPLPTLTRATMDSTNNMVSSMPSSAFWKLAEISMPT
jgi:hypothetical protein